MEYTTASFFTRQVLNETNERGREIKSGQKGWRERERERGEKGEGPRPGGPQVKAQACRSIQRCLAFIPGWFSPFSFSCTCFSQGASCSVSLSLSYRNFELLSLFLCSSIFAMLKLFYACPFFYHIILEDYSFHYSSH